MNRWHRRLLSALFVVCVVLAASGPGALSAQTILGQHAVRKGETLYCLGRGYGVLPAAIAHANGLAASAHLAVGQVLSIPDAPWGRVPKGPVCATQFASPYASSSATAPAVVAGTYTVRRGDTLWRIARTFGVSVRDIQAANGLPGTLIYAGQVLTIPGAAGSAASTAPPPGATPGPTSAANFQHLVSLTQPARPGSDATIIVLTLPLNACSIVVHYKTGPSEAQGLNPKTAGADGICAWTWRVGTNTTPGTWSIVVTTGGLAQTYAFVVQ